MCVRCYLFFLFISLLFFFKQHLIKKKKRYALISFFFFKGFPGYTFSIIIVKYFFAIKTLDLIILLWKKKNKIK